MRRFGAARYDWAQEKNAGPVANIEDPARCYSRGLLTETFGAFVLCTGCGEYGVRECKCCRECGGNPGEHANGCEKAAA